MITYDFETYSAANLKKVGAYNYSLHPTTDVLCAAWTYDEDPDGFTRLWHPAFPEVDLPEVGAEHLEELFFRIISGDVFEAHNAFFERCIWTNVCHARRRWPALHPLQLRCSAAKAAAHALPRELKDLARALRLAVHKDMDGHKLMMQLTRPRKPRVAELKAKGLVKGQADAYTARFGPLWERDPEKLARVFSYCRQDVVVEKASSKNVRDLSPSELKVWQLDQEMNWRGVAIDREGVEKALALANEERDQCSAEIEEITFGTVGGVTDRIGFKDWVNGEGVLLTDTSAETIEWLITRTPDLPEYVKRALVVWMSGNKTSTKKYEAMLTRVAPDGRVRDILRFCAASTGRWAGMGIQIQNFPQGGAIKNMAEAWDDIHKMALEELRAKWGDPMEFLSNALRGALVAGFGKEFVTADFAAIEARGVFWCAGCERALEVIREGDAQKKAGKPVTKNIYWDMTGKILLQLGTPLPQDAPLDKKHEKYQLGKQAILGLGYQMGGPKFRTTCAGYGIEITEEFAGEVVQLYRSTYPEVPKLWRRMEWAAIEATKAGPRREGVQIGKVMWGVRGRYLHCKLPSGRLLSYCEPRVVPGLTPWGEPCERLEFSGVDQKTKQWIRQDTYGGKLVENVVQALSRDLLADALVRGDAAGYTPVLTVHDENVAEVPIGFGGEKAHELERLMSDLPAWAAGLPMDAEGWRGTRYRK